MTYPNVSVDRYYFYQMRMRVIKYTAIIALTKAMLDAYDRKF